jgi:hypothetical protein
MDLSALYELDLDGLAVGDHWAYDEATNLWRCGDLVIALEANDPTRWHVKTSAETTDRRLFGGTIPPFGWGVPFLGFADAANGQVTDAGLDEWYDQAQELASKEYERREQERKDFLKSLPGRTAAELLAQPDTTTDWLVPGFIKRGWATKVGGREKTAGKGTLITHLLGKLERGEATVFGEAAAPISAVVFTEEPEDSMREKIEAAGLQRAMIVWGHELAGRVWKDKVGLLVELAQLGGHEIVFIDNTSRAAQITDEGGVEFARAVEVLQEQCRRAGMTLIIDVHHKKGADAIENKTRGGTGVQGAVDINVEIERVGGVGSRRRKLTAFGRIRAANWVKVIELAEDGRNYVEADDAAESVDDETQKRFKDATELERLGKTTVKEFMAASKIKTLATARKRLDALVEEGRAVKHPGGGGREPDQWEFAGSLLINQSSTK